jgi:transcriptional regulator with XRE-family HTH domain
VSIGDALAAERRQAGLTITQVSQRTCIRETIIRGIEHDDFSACGGDFYARGHIRSIARAVGAEPEPLIREYDATQSAPEGITAADVFEPSTPIRLKERRRPNWSVAMLVALAAIVGIATYHFLSGPTKASPAAVSHPAAASPGTGHSAGTGHAGAGHKKKRKTTSQASAGGPHHVVIALRAARESCWVNLTTHAGQAIFAGTLAAGTSKTWSEEGPVSLEIGNPGAVTLTVNGKNRTPKPGSPVTLTLGGATSTSPTQG